GTWGIMFVGIVECLVLGWIFDIRKLRTHANKNSDWQIGVWWEWFIRLIAPGILLALFIWNLHDDITCKEGFLIDSQGHLIGTDVLGVCLPLIVFLIAFALGLWRPSKTAQVEEFDS
ncbi:MAG: hypothetical protein JW860_11080, partial [Sedimentisphaerales bacterium]|nr:hypothetical protein [Sedimentisphaerales bacterium]